MPERPRAPGRRSVGRQQARITFLPEQLSTLLFLGLGCPFSFCPSAPYVKTAAPPVLSSKVLRTCQTSGIGDASASDANARPLRRDRSARSIQDTTPARLVAGRSRVAPPPGSRPSPNTSPLLQQNTGRGRLARGTKTEIFVVAGRTSPRWAWLACLGVRPSALVCWLKGCAPPACGTGLLIHGSLSGRG